jgi:membrane fusion protein (multidrug efflux system)
VLTTVSQVDPIKAYFPISGAEYLAMASRLNGGGTPLRLDLTLSNGQAYPYTGHVLFADRQLDPQTGTMQIVGSFPNPHNLLRPGQTGQIRAETTVLRHALLIPQRSVTEMQDEYEVAVVGNDNHVAIRPVKVGPQSGSLWVIDQGLKPGDRVIAEGAGSVRNGQQVTPVPYVPSPTPPAPAS